MQATAGNRTVAAVPRGRAPVRVWDRWVRLFHWTLVAAVTVAAVTGFLMDARAIDLHVWAGTLIAALVLARLVWGFLGGRFARFAGFVPAPGAALAHLDELLRNRAARHLGHNPLGGLMIVALLGLLAAIAISGAMVLGGVFRVGPLAPTTGYAVGRALMTLHKLLALGLLVLIALHIAGAVYESLRTRENLVLAMVTGRKRRRPGDQAPPPVRPQPVLAVAIMLLVLAVVAGWASQMALRPLPAAPVAIGGSAYQAQCGDCHAAFHPSLLPAASWAQLMAHLDQHFGEDASLPPADTAEIASWLAAHAAETTELETSASVPHRRSGQAL